MSVARESTSHEANETSMIVQGILTDIVRCNRHATFFSSAGKTEVEKVDASPSISAQPPELGMLYKSLELFDSLYNLIIFRMIATTLYKATHSNAWIIMLILQICGCYLV